MSRPVGADGGADGGDNSGADGGANGGDDADSRDDGHAPNAASDDNGVNGDTGDTGDTGRWSPGVIVDRDDAIGQAGAAGVGIEVPEVTLVEDNDGHYHLYSILLTVGDESWMVFRRFRQLRELHKFAVLNVPGAKHLGFPKRRMLGNRDVSTPPPPPSLPSRIPSRIPLPPSHLTRAPRLAPLQAHVVEARRAVLQRYLVRMVDLFSRDEHYPVLRQPCTKPEFLDVFGEFLGEDLDGSRGPIIMSPLDLS